MELVKCSFPGIASREADLVGLGVELRVCTLTCISGDSVSGGIWCHSGESCPAGQWVLLMCLAYPDIFHSISHLGVCECNVTVHKELEQSSVCVKMSKGMNTDLVSEVGAQAF